MGPASHSDSVIKMIIEHIAASDPGIAGYQLKRQAA
jgi:hypothetical protein